MISSGREPGSGASRLLPAGVAATLAVCAISPIAALAGLLLLAGLSLVRNRARPAIVPRRDDKILTYALLAPVAATSVSALSATGIDWRPELVLILAPVAAVTLLRSGPDCNAGPALWLACVAGAFALAGAELTGRTSGGALALLLAAVASLGTSTLPAARRPLARLLAIIAVLLAAGASLVGLDLNHWQAEVLRPWWQAFVGAPLLGAGWAGIAGEAEPAPALLVQWLARGGLLGLASLLALSGGAASIFRRALRARDAEVRRLGRTGLLTLAGLVLLAALAGGGMAPILVLAAPPLLALLGAAIAAARETAVEQHAARRHSLSATIITKNEADRIEDCLRSLHGWVDEIIVLDSGSSDATVDICRRYTDKVEVTDWPGFGPQKQRALQRATCDWVLSIDADERVTPELRADIEFVLAQPQPARDAYCTPWAPVVAGQRLDFGRTSRAPLRLFRREGASFSDDVVHERVILPEAARIGQLDGRLLHFSHRDFGHQLQKTAEYAWLGTLRRQQRGRRSAGLLTATLRAVWTFAWIYFARLGLLDGRVGFLVAVLFAQRNFNTYAGLWALQRQQRKSPPQV